MRRDPPRKLSPGAEVAVVAPASCRKLYEPDQFSSPVRVFYEVTRAFSKAPTRGTAKAADTPNAAELDTQDARAVIKQISCFPEPPELIITGGDPLRRPDIYVLIRYAAALGLNVTVHLRPTLIPGSVQCLKDAGVHRLSLGLDRSRTRRHSLLRPTPAGSLRMSFHQHLCWSPEQVMRIAREIRAVEIPIQVVTKVGRRNVEFLSSIGDLVEEMGADRWILQFLVPVGSAIMDRRLSPAEYELVFAHLWEQSRLRPFIIDTVAAPQYSRFLLQKLENSLTEDALDFYHNSLICRKDGRGSLFVSHAGIIQPGPFLPIFCGKAPETSVVDIYRHSRTFRALRDPDRQQGKCRYCEYRMMCGGCRARSYAVTGNLHAPEPDCEYIPRRRDEG